MSSRKETVKDYASLGIWTIDGLWEDECLRIKGDPVGSVFPFDKNVLHTKLYAFLDSDLPRISTNLTELLKEHGSPVGIEDPGETNDEAVERIYYSDVRYEKKSNWGIYTPPTVYQDEEGGEQGITKKETWRVRTYLVAYEAIPLEQLNTQMGGYELDDNGEEYDIKLCGGGRIMQLVSSSRNEYKDIGNPGGRDWKWTEIITEFAEPDLLNVLEYYKCQYGAAYLYIKNGEKWEEV